MYEHEERRYLHFDDKTDAMIKELQSIPEAAAVIRNLQEEETDIQSIIDDYDSELYEVRFKQLKSMCVFYREHRKNRPEHPAVRFIDRLIQLDGTNAVPLESGKNNAVSAHNAFVLRFVANMSVMPGICRKLHITERTYFKYERSTLRRMMLLLYGFDGLSPDKIKQLSSTAEVESPVITGDNAIAGGEDTHE